MRVATFNVNSIRARLPIVIDWLKAHQPDLMCLQETKTPDSEFPVQAFTEAGYHVAFQGQKGGNGVAVASRVPVEPVAAGFDDGGPADASRFQAVQAGDVLLVNTYVPQGRALDHPMYAYKHEWFKRLHAWFDARATDDRMVLWVGDMNVAPGPDDVHHPERHGQHVCFHPEIRAALAAVVDWGFTDLYRRHHPEPGEYSFFDYRSPNAIARGLGWRIDLILASPPLAACCRDCWIDLAPRRADRPSDHTVVAADFDGVHLA